MRAMAWQERGRISDLRLVELPVPEPGHGEVRVRVDHSVVNPAELKNAAGGLDSRFIHAQAVPLVAGYDFSGTIDALGPDVEGLAVDDEVCGFLAYSSAQTQGAFAEQVTIAAGEVAVKPPGVTHETAAAGVMVGLTALQALRDTAKLRSGQRVLVLGASGGVGALAVGIAKKLGLTVTGSCSTDAVELVRSLGADEVIDRKRTDPLAGDARYDCVLDTPAAYSFGRCRRVLAPGGTYVTTLPSLGFVFGKLASLLSSKRCAFVVVHSNTKDIQLFTQWLSEDLQVPIDSRFPVRDAALAIERSATAGRRGRVAVSVADGW